MNQREIAIVLSDRQLSRYPEHPPGHHDQTRPFRIPLIREGQDPPGYDDGGEPPWGWDQELARVRAKLEAVLR